MAGSSDFMDRFERLSVNQREIVAEAEREIAVWKAAYSGRDSEITALKKELALLKRTKTESGAASPLVLCLIDGDGCIFNENLLMLGMEGGREAASKLRQHIAGHYDGNTDILVHIFFNREGLGSTIKKYLGVTSLTFSAFISGFNTASPLMSMLDVGAGKEAADAKIRELMRIFVRYPNVKKIYFGGGHDNGYSNNLTTLQNEGYLDKIVLLQSYSQLAVEIKALGLPCLENNGIFLSEKLSNKTTTTNTTPMITPAMLKNKSHAKSPMPPSPVPPSPMPPSPTTPPKDLIKVLGGKNTKANVAILKSLKPRACNHYYLTKKGCNLENCPYGHNYMLADQVLADLRDLVKQNPCLLMNKGLECKDVECPSAHQCPQGPGCSWHKELTCKFVGLGMHGTANSSEDDDDRVLVEPRLTSLHARTGSSSSGAIDFPDYPPGFTGLTDSPGKKPNPTKARLTPTGRIQVKNAFKNSVNGSTSKERLQQMGVGAASDFYMDDDISDSSEQQYSQAQQHPGLLSPGRRLGSNPLAGWPSSSPSKYGIGMNGRRMDPGIY